MPLGSAGEKSPNPVGLNAPAPNVGDDTLHVPAKGSESIQPEPRPTVLIKDPELRTPPGAQESVMTVVKFGLVMGIVFA